MESEDGAGGGHSHGHHPAGQDWPRGFDEASWWPAVTALGVANTALLGQYSAGRHVSVSTVSIYRHLVDAV